MGKDSAARTESMLPVWQNGGSVIGNSRLNNALLAEVTVLICALGLGAKTVFHARRRGLAVMDSLGLRFTSEDGGDLVAGLLIASVAMAGIFAFERAAGGIVSTLRLGSPALLPQAGWMALNALKEEVLMRGLLLSGLLLALDNRRALAIGLSAAAFGLIHLSNPGASGLSVFGNALGGVLYSTGFVLTGRIWLSLGLHFGWNFTQGPLLGLPVSGLGSDSVFSITDHGPMWLTGGSYGPEGGAVGIAFRFVVMAGLLGWLALRRRQAGSP